MLKQLLDFARQVVSLTRDTQQNKKDVQELRQELKEVRQELREFSAVLQRLVFEVQRQREADAYGRKLLRLEVENTLLRSGRQLPPSTETGTETQEQ
jgi:hypothetical protein